LSASSQHDADRYQACNIHKLSGPVDERENFEDCRMIVGIVTARCGQVSGLQ